MDDNSLSKTSNTLKTLVEPLKPIIDAKYYTLGNTKNNSITTNTKIKTIFTLQITLSIVKKKNYFNLKKIIYNFN